MFSIRSDASRAFFFFFFFFYLTWIFFLVVTAVSVFFSRNDSKRNANRRYKKTPQVFVENSAKQKKNAFTNVPIFILKKNKQNKQKSHSDLFFKKSFHRAETCYVMQRNPSSMEKNSVKLGKRTPQDNQRFRYGLKKEKKKTPFSNQS